MVAASILLLDNRDSFVWNLAQAFQVLGTNVVVTRSDTITVDEIVQRRPDAIVLSPGPGTPREAGVCIEAVRELHGTLPILGVCLGHQAIAAAFGSPVGRGEPRHGKTSPIHHRGTGLFQGIPTPFPACRYHSLRVDELPPELERDAWTDDGVVMALSHREFPVFGVQFHPESFRTEHGLELLRNFTEHAA